MTTEQHAPKRTSRAMLVAAAVERGIPGAARLTKPQLIELLEATPPPPILTPPAGMTSEALELWHDLAPRLEQQGEAIAEDAMMLSSFCEATAVANRVRTALSVPVVRSANGTVRVSPALAVWRESTMTALRLAEHFGWTPLARSRMGVVDKPSDEQTTAEGTPVPRLYGPGV